MLTPKGPSLGPSGTPAVALPPSIIASTVFLSASFLDLSSAYELHIVRVYCYRQCCEALFQELDNDLLFDLVDVCDLCFQTSERSTNNLNEVADAKLFDHGFSYYESFDGGERDDAFCSGSGVSCPGDRFINKVGSHCLNENVAFDHFRCEYCYDGQLLGLDPAGHEVHHGSLLSAGCADCVYRSLLSLSSHDLALLSSCGSLASRQLV